MDWDLAVQLIIALIGILAVGTVIFQIRKTFKNRKMIQKIKGDNNIQAGRDVKIERGDIHDNTSKD